MSVCDPLNISVVEEIVLQYGDSVRSFPKDSIFSCKTKVSGEKELECVYL